MTPRLNPEESDANISDVPGAVTTVDLDGNIHSASAETRRVTSLTRHGAFKDTATSSLEDVAATDRLQIAAVGSDVVVWDQDASTLLSHPRSLSLRQLRVLMGHR